MTTVEIAAPTVEPIVAQGRPIASPGSMNVDWEERWDVDRLRTYRLGRARAALAGSDLGAVLLFDFNNIRYVTSTHIGEWARDKMAAYKVPRLVEFVEQLPKTPTGKILWRELQEKERGK